MLETLWNCGERNLTTHWIEKWHVWGGTFCAVKGPVEHNMERQHVCVAPSPKEGNVVENVPGFSFTELCKHLGGWKKKKTPIRAIFILVCQPNSEDDFYYDTVFTLSVLFSLKKKENMKDCINEIICRQYFNNLNLTFFLCCWNIY